MKTLKQNIVKAALAGAFVNFAFVFVELACYPELFGSGVRLLLVDSGFRIVFGAIGLVILALFRGGRLKDRFTNPIPKSVWLLLIPMYVYFLSYFLGFGMVERASAKNALPFLAVILQQVTTGLYEETASRGIVMTAFEDRLNDKKMRVLYVVLSGLIFGLSHCLNFLFGSGGFDLLDTLTTVFCTGMWGIFIAAIYMVSGNLLLVMGIHAVWDIWIRIPNAFFAFSEEPTALAAAGEVLRTVLDPFVMGILGIVIALKYDKLTKKDE